MSKIYFTGRDIIDAAREVIKHNNVMMGTRIWGVPRGGVPVALAIAARSYCDIVDHPEDADLIVDDIYDSGRTCERYSEKPFAVLFDKREPKYAGHWLVMPWEMDADGADRSAEDIVIRLLEFMGEDPNREGLKSTPARVLKAWREWCSGYGQNPAEAVTSFEDGAAGMNEMVVMQGIPVHSHCEHHLAPFHGTATIGYVPRGRIIGLSKLVRLTNIFARRLQVQERLTVQIADALMELLEPMGVGVIIRCRHSCMESRGVMAPDTPTTTSVVRGVFFDDPRARAEFMALR